MSEFYASGDFLDRKQLFRKYFSLISALNSKANAVDRVAFRLRIYSGFGMEKQISCLRKYSAKLRDCKEDISTEYRSLINIIETINDSERKAQGILEGAVLSDEYKLDNYDAVGDVPQGEFSKTFSKVYDLFVDIGKGTTDILGAVCDLFKGTPGFMKSVFEELLGPTFDALDIYNKFCEIVEYFTDGRISFSDFAGTAYNSGLICESALKIFEAITGTKILPKKGITLTDTVKIGGKHVGKYTQYLPVLTVALATVFSGAKTYDRVSADGNVSTRDWAEIGIDASTDGLIVCGEMLAILSGPVGMVGVGAFELVNALCEEIGGTSLKDMVKNTIKSSADYIGGKLNDLMGRLGFGT